MQLLPVLDAELRLVIGAIGERGDAQIRAGEVLRRAQDVHARVAGPRPLAAARRAIEAAKVGHAFAQQREARRLAAHATADDQHVHHRSPVGSIAREHPVRRRVAQLRELVAREALQFGERHIIAILWSKFPATTACHRRGRISPGRASSRSFAAIERS